MPQPTYDVIVIGEGVSGLTVASTLAAAGLKVATLEGQLFGGLIINVNELEPAPEGRAVSGAELASEMMQASADAGVASIQEEVTELRDGGPVKHVTTGSGTYTARHVVVASGARLKRLGVPGEAEFEGRGVSQCADCDGPMYQNEDVIVVGGGDSALQEAIVLARYCRRVHLLHRGTAFSASAHFAEQVKANDKISIVWNATVDAILGAKMVEKARVKRADGGIEELSCAGVFAYIGLAPNSDFLPDGIELDQTGCIKTNDKCETALAGISALGAVRSGFGGKLHEAITEARHAAEAIKTRLRSQPA